MLFCPRVKANKTVSHSPSLSISVVSCFPIALPRWISYADFFVVSRCSWILLQFQCLLCIDVARDKRKHAPWRSNQFREMANSKVFFLRRHRRRRCCGCCGFKFECHEYCTCECFRAIAAVWSFDFVCCYFDINFAVVCVCLLSLEW